MLIPITWNRCQRPLRIAAGRSHHRQDGWLRRRGRRGGTSAAPPPQASEARRHVSGTAAAGVRGAAAPQRRCRRRRLARGQGQAVTLLTGSAASTLAAVLADSRNSGTHFQPTSIPVRRL